MLTSLPRPEAPAPPESVLNTLRAYRVKVEGINWKIIEIVMSASLIEAMKGEDDDGQSSEA